MRMSHSVALVTSKNNYVSNFLFHHLRLPSLRSSIYRAVRFMGTFASKIFRSSAMASSPEVQQLIKEAISQEKVVIFSKTYCPYCKLAKDVSTES